jgi:hypothetical protein
MGRQNFRHHIAEKQTSRAFDSLGANDQRNARRDNLNQRIRRLANRLRRNREKNHAGIRNVFERRRRHDIERERHAGKTPRIDAGRRHLGGMGSIMRPKMNLGRVAGGEIGERRAPGSGAQHGDMRSFGH